MKPTPVTSAQERIIKTKFVYQGGRLFRLVPVGRNSRGGWTYPQIVVGHRAILAHRIIFFMHHGLWPESVDHINGNRNDHRIENLRACTHTENMRNRAKTKTRSQRDMPKGVCRVKHGFHAYLWSGEMRKTKWCRTFKEAMAWRKTMEKKHYGEFAAKPNYRSRNI